MEKDFNILVRDEKYEGKYVAFRSVSDHTVIAEGQTPESVLESAKKNGYDHPMVLYVPNKDISCCY